MYQFITGFYKTHTNKVDWVEDPTSISKTPLSLLFTKYHQVRVVMSVPTFDKLQFINIADLPTSTRTYQGTITAYLTENGNKKLPTINYVQGKKPGVVKYLNYITQGYKTLAVNISKNPNADINRDEKVDALLFRDNLYKADYKDIVSKSVTICNGLLHRAIAGDEGIYVLGAGTTTNLSKVHSFGILDFSEIGEITTIPIKEENIVKYMPGLSLDDAIYLKVPDKYAGKAVMVSIGGILYYLGNIMSRINETLFKIDTDRANIIKRLYESLKYGFDPKPLGISKEENYPDVILAELGTDDFYKKLLTHKLSFFIIADVNDYHVEKVILENPRYPGKYLTNKLPEYPVISELGLIPNFNYKYLDGTFTLHTDLYTREHTIYTTAEWRRLKRLTYTADSYNPRYYQHAHTLIIKYSTE